MQLKFLKNLIYKVLIPCLCAFLIFKLLNKIDFGSIKSNNEVTIVKNNTEHTPQVNWLVGWGNYKAKLKIAEEYVREYSFLHKDVRINLGVTEDIDKESHAQKIVKMIQTNIYDWDVVWIDETVYFKVSQILGDYDWGSKHLVDFQKIQGFSLTQRAEILKNPEILKNMGGVLSGPLLEGFFGVIWYNSEVANALGLEIKDRDMNLNDLIKYAQTVNEFNNRNSSKIALFAESKDWFGISKILFQHLVRSEMEKMKINDAPSKDTSMIILKKVLNDLELLAQYNPLIESHNVIMWHDAKKMFLDNRALFMVGKTNLINELVEIDSIDAIKILPAELLSYGNLKGYIGAFQPSFAIFKTAPNRDAAIDLIESFATPYYSEKWSKQTKNPTGIAVNLKENYLENDPYNKFLIYIAQKYQYNVWYSNYTSYILGKENANLYKLMDDNLRLVISGQITSVDALNNINSNILR